MKYLTVIATICWAVFQQNSFAQSSTNKIDSLMQRYFDIIIYEHEHKFESQDFVRKIYTDKDTLYINPEFGDAISFMEKLTDIEARKEFVKGGHSVKVILSEELIDQWNKWYKTNRHLLIWEDDHRRINRIDKDLYEEYDPN